MSDTPPFRAWRQRLGLTAAQAAKAFEKTHRWANYQDEKPELDRILRLAMIALEKQPILLRTALGPAGRPGRPKKKGAGPEGPTPFS